MYYAHTAGVPFEDAGIKLCSYTFILSGPLGSLVVNNWWVYYGHFPNLYCNIKKKITKQPDNILIIFPCVYCHIISHTLFDILIRTAKHVR